MKRNPRTFSVEIKKTRVPGQRSNLALRRLFATASAEATKVFHREEPQTIAEPSPARRILPSIVVPVWSSSEPVGPVRCKRPPVEGRLGQMEFDLAATASEVVADAPAEAPVSANAVPQTGDALDDAHDAMPVRDVQPAQSEDVKAKSRKLLKKAAEIVERETAYDPLLEAEMTELSVASSKVVQRRLTKRLTAAAQLPRHERWKGRLHPAAW